MARFTFNLEPVLRQRQAEEDRHQRELAKLLRKRMIFLGQLRSMQQTISTSKHELGQSLQGRVDLSAVGQFARYNSQCEVRARQIVGQMAGLERQIQAQRATLNEAVKARRAIELLKEKRRRQWQQQQQRREDFELDDLALQRYALGLQEAI